MFLAPTYLFSISTHLSLVPHMVSRVIIGSGKGLSPIRRQATIWTNAGLLLIGFLGTNFSEIWIGILSISFKKMHSKMSSAKLGAILSRGAMSWHLINHEFARSLFLFVSVLFIQSAMLCRSFVHTRYNCSFYLDYSQGTNMPPLTTIQGIPHCLPWS